MKDKGFRYVILGLSAGLIAWAFQELLLVFTHYDIIPLSVKAALTGGLVGVIFGVFFGAKEGFFTKDVNKMKKGALVVGSLGLISGAILFFSIEILQAFIHWILVPESILPGLFYSQRWILLALSLGVAVGIRDQFGIMLTRGILSGIAAGIVGAVLCFLASVILDNSFFIRGVSLISFGIVLFYSAFYFANYKKKEWVRILNGNQEGFEFELFKNIHHIGCQVWDEINLKSYQDINSSHAKLIKYPCGYSLVDNDPLGRTFVNYRTISEQPLKNGDVIKIGDALFQYCQVS
ncbi:MAG: FHA domain-containing protein [Deltaproteobacteria bacterium]|nr:FHA domain-containing protein [Deltaproteobacteria bacterium]